MKNIKNKLSSVTLSLSQDFWQKAAELLKLRQYDDVCRLLDQAQRTSQQAGDRLLFDILSAANRICMACIQCCAGADFYNQAMEESIKRENDLAHQLCGIFDLLAGNALPIDKGKEPVRTGTSKNRNASSKSDASEPSSCSTIGQRIQSLLARGLPSRQSERKSSCTSPMMTPSPMISEADSPYVQADKYENDQALPSLVIYCLGPFQVYQNDRLITEWNGLKGICLLKYLVVHRKRPIAKDILMDVFWSEAGTEAARRNLHQAIYCLRQTLRRSNDDFQYIQFKNDCYFLSPDLRIWVDYEEFEKHVQFGRRCEANGQIEAAIAEYGVAEGLYLGDFLEEDLYIDWPNAQRDHIRNMYFSIVDRLNNFYFQQREFTTVVTLCKKLLAQDNCHEEAHGRLMQCYVAQGHRHLVVRQYQTCVRALKEELDITPSEELVALYHRLMKAP